jgi:D-alanyl-D-alanine endopeptidase (penicillin-binding protein 7)
MKRRLPIVFSGLIAIFAAAVTHAQNPVVLNPAKLRLASANALVFDATEKRAIYVKAADEVTPIASLTKLMTAIVTLVGQPLDEPIAIDMDDLDFVKGTSSRLRMGAELPRREMLRLALMSSENRAASSLARNYPGGRSAFVAAMNAKAASLGMTRTRFADPTGSRRKCLDGERPRTARQRCRTIPADPRIQHHWQPLRRARFAGRLLGQ